LRGPPRHRDGEGALILSDSGARISAHPAGQCIDRKRRRCGLQRRAGLGTTQAARSLAGSHPKPQIRPAGSTAAKPTAQGVRPVALGASPAARSGAVEPGAQTSGAGTTGKVVHDDRGQAVWQWVRETSRIAIESTSRLLRKLEAPNLTMEDAKDEELRITPDPSAGGGYDPYNQPIKPPRSGRK